MHKNFLLFYKKWLTTPQIGAIIEIQSRIDTQYGSEEKDMKATLTKIEKFWMLLIEREDGSRNDYRFNTKAQAQKWAKAAGIEI